MLIRDFLKTRAIKITGHPAALRYRNQSPQNPIRTPVEEPPNEPQTPPFNEPGDPVERPPEPDRPPVEEPGEVPSTPPVKEPPVKKQEHARETVQRPDP
jgi:hypothetical protein